WNTCPLPPPFPLTYGAPASCANAIALNVPIGYDRNAVSSIPGQEDSLSSFEEVLTLNYRQWGLTFSSVTGFYNYHAYSQGDGDQLPQDLFTFTVPEKFYQFSQEFRVTSPSGGALEYLAGVYFQTDTDTANSWLGVPFINFVASIPGFTGLAPYLPLAAW